MSDFTTDANRDGNFVPTLLAVSSDDGITPVKVAADPTTGRILVDLAGSSSVSVEVPTGTVNDTNVDFVFTSEPLTVTVNGLTYRKDHGWTWNSGTNTATLAGPVGTGGDIFGIISV